MRLSARISCGLTLFAGLACLPGLLHSQGLTGQVSGTVVDQTSAAVANASLTITSSVTGQSRTTKSNADGYFVFPELLPGVYDLAAEAAGFGWPSCGHLITA